MSEYVPTTEVVKDSACWQRKRLGEPRGVGPEAFDRWLAQIRAEAAVTALRDASMEFYRDAEGEWDGYGVSHALTIDADRIARALGLDKEDDR